MKHFQRLLLTAAVILPAAQAAAATPWDQMLQSPEVSWSSTVSTKAGKTYKSEGVTFSATEVTLHSNGTSIPREEVKDVVIREKWGKCCEDLWWGAQVLGFGVSVLATEYFPLAVPLIVVGLPVAAVTLPPALLIQAFRHLTWKESYKVIP